MMGCYDGTDFEESKQQLRNHLLLEPVIGYKEKPYRPQRRQRQQPVKEEPTWIDCGTSPHASILQRDFGMSPEVSTFRDFGMSPEVSTFRDFGMSPDVSTFMRDQTTSPHISTLMRDQGANPHVQNYMGKRQMKEEKETYWPEVTGSTWSGMMLRMLGTFLLIMVVFIMLQQSGVLRSFGGDQKSLNEDKKIFNGDQTWGKEEQRNFNDDQGILNGDQKLLNDDERIFDGDQESVNDDQKIFNEDQKDLNEDKILNGDQGSMNDDQKILNGDQSILNDNMKARGDSSNTGWKFFVVSKKGSIYFNLPQPKVTTHLTLAHLAKVKAANGAVASAPRDFSLYGTKDGKEHLLGRFTFDEGGTVHQTFTVPGQEAYRTLRLTMESNWEDTAFTCFHVWFHNK